MYLRRMNFEICLLALQHIMIASILDYFAKIVEFELTEDDSITGQFRRIREPKFSENDLKIDDDASAAEILRQIFQILLRYDCASAFFEAATTSPKLFHCRQCIENVDSAVDDDQGPGRPAESATDCSNFLPKCLNAVGDLLTDVCSGEDEQNAARILRGMYAVLEGIPFGRLQSQANTADIDRLMSILLKTKDRTESSDLANLAASCALAVANASASADQLFEVAANFLCESHDACCCDEQCGIPSKFLHDYNRTRNIASDVDPMQLLHTVVNIRLESTIDTSVENLRFCSDGRYLFVICSSGLFKIGTGFGATVAGRLYGSNDMLKAKTPTWIAVHNGLLYVRRTNTSKLCVLDPETLLSTGEVLLPFQAMRGWLCSDESALVLLRVNDADWRLESYFLDDFSVIETPECTVSLKETKFYGAGAITASHDVDHLVSLLNHHFDASADVKTACLNDDGCMMVLLRDGRAYYFGKAAKFGFADELDAFRLLFPQAEPKLVDIKISSNFLVFETTDGRLSFGGKYSGEGEMDRPSNSKSSASLLQTSSGVQQQTLAHGAKSFACSAGSMALIDRRGHLRIFGKESYGLSGGATASAMLRMKRLTQVALGKAHVLLVAGNEGSAYSFGLNQYGQCGQDAVVCASNFRLPLGPVAIPVDCDEFHVLSATCGNFHSVLLSDAGLVACCGLNRYGQLGIGNFDNQSRPVQLL